MQPLRQEFYVDGRDPSRINCDAVRFGDLVFLSGCGPLDADRSLVGGDDFQLQAEHVFARVRAALAVAGSSAADVLKLTTYLSDIRDVDRSQSVRRKFFGDTRPASTLVEVSAFAVPGMRLEVDVVAAVSPQTFVASAAGPR